MDLRVADRMNGPEVTDNTAAAPNDDDAEIFNTLMPLPEQARAQTLAVNDQSGNRQLGNLAADDATLLSLIPGLSDIQLQPPEQLQELTQVILDVFASLPQGVAGIVGTRINAIPEDLTKLLPENIRNQILEGRASGIRNLVGGASAAIAFIFPPDSVQRLQDMGPVDGLLSILRNTTIWLGMVPPSGVPAFPSGNTNPPSLSDPFRFPGADAAYVMTINFVNGLNVDLRAGWAYLNDVPLYSDPLNAVGQPLIVPDKGDPDTWLFLNAGVSGSLRNVLDLPQVFNDGFEQLADAVNFSTTPSGTPQFEFNFGGIVTGGALVRVPFTEKAADAIGNWMLKIGAASAATGIGALFGGMMTGVGVLFKQSTGIYFGGGLSLSRLSLSGLEVSYSIPGSTYSFNLGDTPAAAVNLAADIAGAFNDDFGEQISNSVAPTRTTLAEIIDTPTYVIGGNPVANRTRLGLYWDYYLEKLPATSPGVDLVTIGRALVTAYNDSNATQAEKQNIGYLWSTQELEPVRLLFDNMLLDPSGENFVFPSSIDFGNDGVLGMEDLPALFEYAKDRWGGAQGDPNNYSSRLARLARSLYDTGWSQLFNGDGDKDGIIIPDLVSAIRAVEQGLGAPAQENPLLDELLPLYQADPTQASSRDGVLVAIGDLNGLFDGPSTGSAPAASPAIPLDVFNESNKASDRGLTSVVLLGAQSGVEIDFNNPQIQEALAGTEIFGATDFDDVIKGNFSNRTILGLGGNDTITGIDNSIIYGDYTPDLIESRPNLPQGDDVINMGSATVGAVYAGGGNDRVSKDVTARVAADGTTTINFPAGPGADGTPGLTLDGGAGDGDTLVLRITNPVPYKPVFSVADLPANITNFENVELIYDLGTSELTGIGGVPVANTAPDLFTTDKPQNVDVIVGSGARPGADGGVYLDISGPSMFGGAMASLSANSKGDDTGVISATMIDLTPGQETSFTFATEAARRTGANPEASDAPNGRLRVLVDDTELAIIDVGADWSEHTLSFIPTSASATIKFEAIGSNDTTPSPLAFDEASYLAANPDVAAAVAAGSFGSGFDHFIRYGVGEGRTTSSAGRFPPVYNESAYLAANPDVAAAVVPGGFRSGFEHFLKYGAAEGRNGGGEPLTLYYDEAFYLANNPDVANAVNAGGFTSGFEHFIRFGAGEGRPGRAPDLDVIVIDTPSIALLNKQVIGDGVDTGQRLKIGDIRRTDPSLTEAATFTVSGEDADLVEIDGNGIYLKAGVSLNAATNPTIDIVVEATEPGLNVINGVEGIDARRAFSFDVIAGQTFIAPDVPVADDNNNGGGDGGTGDGGTGGGGTGGGGIGGGGGGIGGGGGGIGGGGSVGGPGPIYTPPLPPGDDLYYQRSLAIEPLQLPSGNFVFVWQQSSSGGRNTRYFGLVMQPDGTPVGGASATPFEIFAGQTNANNASYEKITVTATEDGGFVISGIYNNYDRDASAPGGGNDVIQAQFYNASGVAQGDLITVNPSDTGSEYNLKAVTAPGGGVGLIWQSIDNIGSFDSNEAIRGRILKSSTDTGVEFEVFANTTPDDDWSEDIVDVDVIDDKIFVVAQVGAGEYGYIPNLDQVIDFANNLAPNTDNTSPVQRVFAGQVISTTGTPIQSQPTAFTSNPAYSTAVEIRPDGSVVTAEIRERRTSEEEDGVVLRLYGPNGTLNAEVQASVRGDVDPNNLYLTRLENGNVALSWKQTVPSESDSAFSGIFTQTFSITGPNDSAISGGTATRIGLDSHNPNIFSRPIALANGAYAIPYTVFDGNYANGSTLFVQNVAADGTLGNLITVGDANNVAYNDIITGKLATGGLATAFTMNFTQVQDEDAAVAVLERQNI